MELKSEIKKVIGPKNVGRIKAGKAFIKYVKYSKVNPSPRLTIRSDEWEKPRIFSIPHKHVFFGYYDIQQLNMQQDKMLVTVIAKAANAKKDKAELQWIDLASGKYYPIALTAAWCWQQGARLRWHPVKENIILYNDVESNHYVTKMYELSGKKLIDEFPCALYDITSDFTIGLSLNYSRLQRLRPGYGYSILRDHTITEKVPREDGIFQVDLQKHEVKLIISYEQLVDLTPDAINQWNYINHISIAPDGKHFIFFHLWTSEIGARWKMKLYTARIDGSELECLEADYTISHYCWKNNNELLTTSAGFGGMRSYYLIYNIADKTRKIIESPFLENDGHPSFISDKVHFITDTYPLGNCLQHIFYESIEGKGYQPILDIFSDPRMFDEKRCDLHPRITPDNRYFTIDSTFQAGVRSVLLFKHK